MKVTQAAIAAALLAIWAASVDADPTNPEPESNSTDQFTGYWFSVDETTNTLKGIVQVTATEGGGVFVSWMYAPAIKGAQVAPNITHGIGKVKNNTLAVSWGDPAKGVGVSIYEWRKDKERVRIVGEGEIWRRAIPPNKTVSVEAK